MSAELIPHNFSTHIPAPANLDDLQRLSKMLVASGYFKGVRDIAQGAVKIMAGQEIGISPVASLQCIHFINDRLCYEAVILASALKRKGYTYKGESTDKGASITFFDQSGKTLGATTFTAEEAVKAGLSGKDVYKKWAQDMYWARAMSRGCRRYCADVFGGPVYSPEDFDVHASDARVMEQNTSPHPLVTDSQAEIGNEVVARSQSDQTNALNATLAARKTTPRGEVTTDQVVSQIPLERGDSDRPLFDDDFDLVPGDRD